MDAILSVFMRKEAELCFNPRARDGRDSIGDEYQFDATKFQSTRP